MELMPGWDKTPHPRICIMQTKLDVQPISWVKIAHARTITAAMFSASFREDHSSVSWYDSLISHRCISFATIDVVGPSSRLNILIDLYTRLVSPHVRAPPTFNVQSSNGNGFKRLMLASIKFVA